MSFISPPTNQDPLLISHSVFTIYSALYIFLLFPDAGNKPGDDLTKLATTDVEDILAMTWDISKGILFHVCQSLLKEWGADLLGVLLEDMMQELLIGVTTQNYLYSHSHPSSLLKFHSLFIPGPESAGTGHPPQM